MSAAEQVRLAGQFQAEQRATAAALVRDIVTLLGTLLALADPEGSWTALKVALKALVRDRRAQSARAAGPYYQRIRAEAGVAGEITPAPPRPLTEERLDRALDGAGLHVFQRAVRTGASPAQARDRAAVTLSGTASRLALEGGRDVMEATTVEDWEAIGWARISDGDPCAWCAMLISRGAVYKSARTAGDVRYGGEKFHDHDACQVVPIFSYDSPHEKHADELYADWKRVTAGHSGAEARRVWRRWWDGNRQTGDDGDSSGGEGSS